MKRRERAPWMPAAAYGQSLHGMTVNLLVRDIPDALRFQQQVLAARVVYSDPDFALIEGYGAEWMLHADHTYDSHPLKHRLQTTRYRGGTLELRLHGCDPDRATTEARALGYEVLQAPSDKPHGLREAYLIDTDGYLWVPDLPHDRRA